MSVSDQTYCASPTCVGKCGRKLSTEAYSAWLEGEGRFDFLCWAHFCDEDGEPIYQAASPLTLERPQ